MPPSCKLNDREAGLTRPPGHTTCEEKVAKGREHGKRFTDTSMEISRGQNQKGVMEGRVHEMDLPHGTALTAKQG